MKMASTGFDTASLQRLGRDLLRCGEAYSKKEKKFLRQEGSKLLRKTKKEAKRVGKKTGNYQKSIKRGKPYSYRRSNAIRVYSYAPHAHLIEEGHRMVTHDGQEVGFVQGHHVFETAARDFEPQFQSDLDDFLEGTVRL